VTGGILGAMFFQLRLSRSQPGVVAESCDRPPRLAQIASEAHDDRAWRRFIVRRIDSDDRDRADAELGFNLRGGLADDHRVHVVSCSSGVTTPDFEFNV
jgi:hypothetical protein